MKSRSGFVSNSSSSSFVLTGSKTVLEYARLMVPYREWDDEDDKLDAQLKSLQDDPDWNDDAAVWFKSCNYDTLIAKLGDHIYIATCNNHSFYEAFDCCESPRVDVDIMEKELGLIMNEEDAENFAHDIYDLYMDEYKCFFTYVGEEYIEESKADVDGQPKYIGIKKKQYKKELKTGDRLKYTFDDNMTFEMFKDVLIDLKLGNVQIHCDESRFKELPPELQRLFSKY